MLQKKESASLLREIPVERFPKLLTTQLINMGSQKKLASFVPFNHLHFTVIAMKREKSKATTVLDLVLSRLERI